MKLKKFALAASASLAFTFAGTSQAETFVGCVSTKLATFDGTVVDAAIATPDLSTLVDAVVAAGLVDALSEAQGITVYAPTNDAFAAVNGDVLGGILADTDLLTTVLTYHVTPALTDPRKFVDPRAADTLAGPRVFLQRSGGEARVNNAAVSCQGVKTDNGTVWIIDSVLLP